MSHDSPTSEDPQELLDDDFEDDDPAEVEREWEEEIRRRVADMESGAVEFIPAEEVFARIRARRWDEQIARDVAAGRLDALADEALAEFRAGLTRELDAALMRAMKEDDGTRVSREEVFEALRERRGEG